LALQSVLQPMNKAQMYNTIYTLCWPEEIVCLLTDEGVGKYKYDHDHKQQHATEPWEVETVACNDCTAVAKSQLLTVAMPKTQAFWGAMLCSSQHSQVLQGLHLQGQGIQEQEVTTDSAIQCQSWKTWILNCTVALYIMSLPHMDCAVTRNLASALHVNWQLGDVLQ
jgi:hypothetical protein